ncbi:MAG: hypothetical protein Q7T53_12865 [Deltaproteobacteria bacterium]|nr:hypothetical protein [Deltaproteobacteria bacterium]
MDAKELIWTKRVLFLALFLIAVSGLMLHYRIHNFINHDPAHPGFSPTYFLANLFPFIDVVLVTILFASKKTSVYGYVLNGMIVIYGTVFMAHFSIAELTAKSAPIQDWLIKSTIPDIGIAWGDFFVGKALYDLNMKT